MAVHVLLRHLAPCGQSASFEQRPHFPFIQSSPFPQSALFLHSTSGVVSGGVVSGRVSRLASAGVDASASGEPSGWTSAVVGSVVICSLVAVVLVQIRLWQVKPCAHSLDDVQNFDWIGNDCGVSQCQRTKARTKMEQIRTKYKDLFPMSASFRYGSGGGGKGQDLLSCLLYFGNMLWFVVTAGGVRLSVVQTNIYL